MKSRWITRNGEKVLQERVEAISATSDWMRNTIWIDVPIEAVQEEKKLKPGEAAYADHAHPISREVGTREVASFVRTTESGDFEFTIKIERRLLKEEDKE